MFVSHLEALILVGSGTVTGQGHLLEGGGLIFMVPLPGEKSVFFNTHFKEILLPWDLSHSILRNA